MPGDGGLNCRSPGFFAFMGCFQTAGERGAVRAAGLVRKTGDGSLSLMHSLSNKTKNRPLSYTTDSQRFFTSFICFSLLYQKESNGKNLLKYMWIINF